MYQIILSLHSIFRWLVLISLIYAIFRGFYGWFTKSPFSKTDNMSRQVTASLVHVQFLLGLILYFVSPITQYFIAHFSEAMKNPMISFFGMSHSAAMLIAVIIITVGLSLSKKTNDDINKFKFMTIFYSIGLILIFFMIPWSFSPFAVRPLFRLF